MPVVMVGPWFSFRESVCMMNPIGRPDSVGKGGGGREEATSLGGVEGAGKKGGGGGDQIWRERWLRRSVGRVKLISNLG